MPIETLKQLSRNCNSGNQHYSCFHTIHYLAWQLATSIAEQDCDLHFVKHSNLHFLALNPSYTFPYSCYYTIADNLMRKHFNLWWTLPNQKITSSAEWREWQVFFTITSFTIRLPKGKKNTQQEKWPWNPLIKWLRLT